MMCSYYTSEELEKAKKVEDKELNELLQEVREKDDNYFLLERSFKVKQGWFKKSIERVGYTLLYSLGSVECQVINFAQDHEWSINGTVSKAYIHTLFCGFLNGYIQGEKKIK